MNLLSTALVLTLLFNPITQLGDIEKINPIGDIEHTTVVQPVASLYNVNTDKETSEVEKFLFTSEQVASAQKTTVDLLVKDFIVSPATAGTRAQYITYLKNLQGYTTTLQKQLTPDPIPGTPYTPIIPVTTPENQIPIIASDIAETVGETKIVVDEITATEYKNTPQLVFTYQFDTKYQVTDENVLNYLSSQPGITREQAQKLVATKIFTPGGSNWFKVHGKIQFTVQPADTTWEVVGLTTKYDYDITDFLK